MRFFRPVRSKGVPFGRTARLQAQPAIIAENLIVGIQTVSCSFELWPLVAGGFRPRSKT